MNELRKKHAIQALNGDMITDAFDPDCSDKFTEECIQEYVSEQMAPTLSDLDMLQTIPEIADTVINIEFDIVLEEPEAFEERFWYGSIEADEFHRKYK